MEFQFIGTGYGLKKDGSGEIYGFIVANEEATFIMNREKIDGTWVEVLQEPITLVADEK